MFFISCSTFKVLIIEVCLSFLVLWIVPCNASLLWKSNSITMAAKKKRNCLSTQLNFNREKILIFSKNKVQRVELIHYSLIKYIPTYLFFSQTKWIQKEIGRKGKNNNVLTLKEAKRWYKFFQWTTNTVNFNYCKFKQ